MLTILKIISWAAMAILIIGFLMLTGALAYGIGYSVWWGFSDSLLDGCLITFLWLFLSSIAFVVFIEDRI